MKKGWTVISGSQTAVQEEKYLKNAENTFKVLGQIQ